MCVFSVIIMYSIIIHIWLPLMYFLLCFHFAIRFHHHLVSLLVFFLMFQFPGRRFGSNHLGWKAWQLRALHSWSHPVLPPFWVSYCTGPQTRSASSNPFEFSVVSLYQIYFTHFFFNNKIKRHDWLFSDFIDICSNQTWELCVLWARGC